MKQFIISNGKFVCCGNGFGTINTSSWEYPTQEGDKLTITQTYKTTQVETSLNIE